MTADELAIHNVIARWTEGSSQGDYAVLEPLMHPDVLFLTAGNEPFGREAFRQGFLALTETMSFQASTEVFELGIADDLAVARTFISVRISPKPTPGDACPPDPAAPPDPRILERKGHVLSVFRRNQAGDWQLYRDANLMTR